MADKEKTEESKPTEKQNNTTKDETKERAVNPMAMRPEGVKVTIKTTRAEVIKMAKKYGF
jgi:hypothetical protein